MAPPPLPPPLPPPESSTKPKDDLNHQMKKLCWNKIQPYNISNESLWLKFKTDRPLNDDSMLASLSKNFSSKTKICSPKSFVQKPTVDLRVLNIRTAQNILILLRVGFKNVSHDQIKQYIMDCDTSMLKINFIEELQKALPNPHEVDQLQKLKNANAELSDVEIFVANITDIERLLSRLDCIKFKLRYDEMIENVESNLRSGIAACAEVIASVKFAKVLQIILSIGNHLNAGSKIGDAIGFELAILTKLDDVKSGDNQHSLLHFVVESIEKEHPVLVSFGLEISNTKVAARVDWDDIDKTIEELSVSTTMLKNELLITKDQKFIDVMLPFSLECEKRVEMFMELQIYLRENYQKVAQYFHFSGQKFHMRDFFSTINLFVEMFFKAHKQFIQVADKNQSKLPTGTPKSKKKVQQTKNRELTVKLKRLTKEGMYHIEYD